VLTIANKAVFVVLVMGILLAKWVDFRLIIVADLVTKVLLLAVNMYKSQELFRGEVQTLAQGFKEYRADVKVGINLMFANVVSSLLIGIGMFIVERFMPLATYSLYSFATNMLNFTLVFITASSLALYPLLKRLPAEKLPIFYVNLNKLICLVLFLLLAGYYPIYYFITYQFHSFVGIFDYFYLLFIIVVSQGKMQFLINTYYKVLREEKAMLLANLSGAVVALIIIIPTFYVTHSIFAVVVGTTITLIWRCYASEIYLKQKMGLTGYGNIAAELLMMMWFIVCVVAGKSAIGFVLYILAVCVYGVINRVVLKGYVEEIFKMVTTK